MAFGKRKFEPKNNTFTLFLNDKKEKDSQPDYKGSGLIDNTEVWVAGWKKKGKKGTFLSCSIQPKDEAGASQTKDESDPF